MVVVPLKSVGIRMPFQRREPLKSVTHGHYDARPTVTFPVAGHHRPLPWPVLGDTTCFQFEQFAEGWQLESALQVQCFVAAYVANKVVYITPPGHAASTKSYNS